MRRIRLLSLPDPRFAADDPRWEPNRLDYRFMIEQAVRIPLDPERGADIDEMRRGIRIFDALDRAADTLELEDADWDYLKHKVEKMPWSMVDRRFIQFYDDIMQASEAPRGSTRADGLATRAG